MTKDTLSRYDQLRRAGREVNSQLLKALEREEYQSAGEALGLFRQGILIFANEDDPNVLMDYAVHRRVTGSSPAERFLTEQAARLEGAERDWAEATARARFRLLRLGRRTGPGQTEAVDLLTGERVLLVDRGVAETGSPGLGLASFALDFPGFITTSGGGVALPEAAVEPLLYFLRQSGYPVGTPAMTRLPPERQDTMEATLLRALLAARASEDDPDGTLEDFATSGRRRPPLLSRFQRGPARNAPCPCGSGRRYKSCCEKTA